MRIDLQNKMTHYLHLSETYPLLSVITAVAVLVCKFLYRNCFFSPHRPFQAYIQDRSIKSCIINLLGKTQKPKVGIRQLAIQAINAQKQNNVAALKKIKDHIRFNYFKLEETALKQDQNLLCEILKITPYMTLNAHHFPNFTDHFVEKILKSNGRILWYLNTRHKQDPYFVKIACYQNGASLLDADPIFKSNKEIALIAIKTAPYIYKDLHEDLKSDLELVEELLNLSKDNMALISAEIKNALHIN